MKRLVISLVFSAAWDQQLASPTFDAASIKENHGASNGMGGWPGIRPGGSLSMRNVPVRMLIQIAYGLAGYEVSRGPAWTESVGYDIEAKPEHPVKKETGRLMFQNLLAERFHLRVHREKSIVPGFRLLVAKGGNRLKQSESKNYGFRIQSMVEIQGVADMPVLAETLRGILGAPVEDQPGSTAYTISN